MSDPDVTADLPLTRAASLTLPQAAALYAHSGVAVFPCIAGTKRPATENGLHDATTDPDRVARWWDRLPASNIGLRTGEGIDVLDIDYHPTGDGFTRLRSLLENGFAGSWTHAVRTPSGGLHLYYPSDPGREQRSWSRPREHIDFRGAGGYIITPPSRIDTDGGVRGYHPVGPTYRDSRSTLMGSATCSPHRRPRARLCLLVSVICRLMVSGSRRGWPVRRWAATAARPCSGRPAASSNSAPPRPRPTQPSPNPPPSSVSTTGRRRASSAAPTRPRAQMRTWSIGRPLTRRGG